MSLDKTIDQAFKPISDFVASIVFYKHPIEISGATIEIPFILAWLAAASLFFTIYLGFINLRYFGHCFALLKNKSGGKGELTNYQALATSLSSTVGLGNIAGVAVAVTVGGPGAVFWMAIMGFLGMSAKFAEATLGVKYRQYLNPNNPEEVSGGPMYYLKAAMDKKDQKMFGTFLAIFFSICCIGGAIGAGNMFQANQTFQQVVNVTGGETGFMADKGWLFGLFLALLVGGVIFGGLKSIAAVSSKIVPLMGGLYLVAGLIVIAFNYQNIPHGLSVIFENAFTSEAGIGGVLGAMLAGIQRAAFSNEAGVGSAAIVHATAKTNEPIEQGFIGMLGPFIDTVVICMVTALVIVMTGVYEGSQGVNGVTLTSQAFQTVMPWFPPVLAFIVFLFAYSTLIGWYYYGEKGLTYVAGQKPGLIMAYKLIYCACVVIGSASALDNIILFSDSMIFAMAVPNIIGLYVLAPELKQDLKNYLQKIENKK